MVKSVDGLSRRNLPCNADTFKLFIIKMLIRKYRCSQLCHWTPDHWTPDKECHATGHAYPGSIFSKPYQSHVKKKET